MSSAIADGGSGRSARGRERRVAGTPTGERVLARSMAPAPVGNSSSASTLPPSGSAIPKRASAIGPMVATGRGWASSALGRNRCLHSREARSCFLQSWVALSRRTWPRPPHLPTPTWSRGHERVGGRLASRSGRRRSPAVVGWNTLDRTHRPNHGCGSDTPCYCPSATTGSGCAAPVATCPGAASSASAASESYLAATSTSGRTGVHPGSGCPCCQVARWTFRRQASIGGGEHRASERAATTWCR